MEHIKEVHFHEYCKKCEYSEEPEDCDKCADCLNESCRIDSHKPINFKEKE